MGSGGSFISGWIIHLFPFLDEGRKNYYCWKGNSWKNIEMCDEGLKTFDFSYHMNQVPFTWNYHGTEINMLFAGGLVGVNVNETDSALTPVFGYGVMEDKKEPEKDEDDWY